MISQHFTLEHDVVDDNDDDDNFMRIRAKIKSKYEENFSDNSDFVISYTPRSNKENKLECKKAVELSTFNST